MLEILWKILSACVLQFKIVTFFLLVGARNSLNSVATESHPQNREHLWQRDSSFLSSLKANGIYSFARICSPATVKTVPPSWDREERADRERREEKRTLNLRSPASGRNVSRVDISIPAPTRCFLPREQDSLSPPSSPTSPSLSPSPAG